MRCRGFAGRFYSLRSFRTTAGDIGKFAWIVIVTWGAVVFEHLVRRFV
jgi:hypothetical protein